MMERSNSQSNFNIDEHDAELDLARAEYENYAQQSLSKDAFLRSKEIDKEIRRNKKVSNQQYKLLVLGTSLILAHVAFLSPLDAVASHT
jgi:hypothetical protein